MLQNEIVNLIHKIKEDTIESKLDFDKPLTSPKGADLSEIDLVYLYLELQKKYQKTFLSKDIQKGLLNSINGIVCMLQE